MKNHHARQTFMLPPLLFAWSCSGPPTFFILQSPLTRFTLLLLLRIQHYIWRITAPPSFGYNTNFTNVIGIWCSLLY